MAVTRPPTPTARPRLERRNVVVFHPVSQLTINEPDSDTAAQYPGSDSDSEGSVIVHNSNDSDSGEDTDQDDMYHDSHLAPLPDFPVHTLEEIRNRFFRPLASQPHIHDYTAPYVPIRRTTHPIVVGDIVITDSSYPDDTDGDD